MLLYMHVVLFHVSLSIIDLLFKYLEELVFFLTKPRAG